MNDNLHINEEGLKIIRNNSLLSLKSYLNKEVWTIGYGHTDGVAKGQFINSSKADSFLRSDCEKAENIIKRLVSVQLTENQFSALVSFVFSVNEKEFETSTLLKRINENNFRRVADEFMKWIVDSSINQIQARREKEKALFLKP